MRVLVTGGREFSDRSFVVSILDRVHLKRPITTIIEGGARGADAMGRFWATRNGITLATVEADWDLYRGHAGRVRNAKMLRDHVPQLVIAFKGGVGTAHMIRISEEARVPVLKTWNFLDSRNEKVASTPDVLRKV